MGNSYSSGRITTKTSTPPPNPTILPSPVKSGDGVLIISPGGIVDPVALSQGCELLRSWGLHPIIHPQVHLQASYFAGSDENRANAVVEAFQDKFIKAIICAKGGYGCTRLLELLSEKLAADDLLISQKRFYGFSDITALHGFLQNLTPGYVSFHSPMIATWQFLNGTESCQLALKSALFGSELSEACPPLYGKCIQRGRAAHSGGVVKGRLTGGNMSLVTSLLGTKWQLKLKGAVLFLEDVNEPPYKIDRMLTHIIQAAGGASTLSQLAALVLGEFSTPDSEPEIDDWFWTGHMNLPHSLPILSGIPVGHSSGSRVLPLGAVVEVDVVSGRLKVIDL